MGRVRIHETDGLGAMFRSFALNAAPVAVFLSLTSCGNRGNPVDTEVPLSLDEFISGSIDADCDWCVRCGRAA